MLSITTTAKNGDRAKLSQLPSKQDILKYFSRCICLKYEIVSYEKEEMTSEFS
jgi:hypothetical protein